MGVSMNEIVALAPCDFHVHTAASHDGRGTVAEYCERAVQQHLTAIGFCEHLDLDPRDQVSGQHDYEAYRAQIEAARARFGDRLMIRMGVEVGYVPRIRDEIRDYLAGHPYDYVIGSVHAIDDGMAGISDEYEALETFARRECLNAYHEYFELTLELVVSGLADAIGHLDLVQRYGVNYLKGPLEWGPFYGLMRRIFEGMIKRQIALEINTSGLRQGPQNTYPPRELVRLYRELDGEMVILGSDAHEPANLASGIPTAVKLVRELDLRPVSFKDRLPEALG
jgi:histidinol-phosphatase (PHP family)